MMKIKTLTIIACILSSTFAMYSVYNSVNYSYNSSEEYYHSFSQLEMVVLADEWYDNEMNNLNLINPLVADDWFESGPVSNDDGGGGFVGYDAPIGSGIWLLTFLTILYTMFKIKRKIIFKLIPA